MNIATLTMLVLSSCAQVGQDQRRIPDPPVMRINIGVKVGPLVRHMTLSWPPPPALAEEDDVQPAPVGIGFRLETAVVERENFDRWLFGDDPPEIPKKHLEEILVTKVAAAVREHNLTGQQRAKLQLAGRGDIKRFFDEVENRRTDFESDRKAYKTGLASLRRLEPLSKVYQSGPFEDGSLFVKTLRKLNEDRRAGRSHTGRNGVD